MGEDLRQLLPLRRGHFLFESGHHGDLWLDLELLCLNPRHLRPFAAELARRLRKYQLDVVCGPLVEGAFIGLMVANELDVEFIYTERFTKADCGELFPVTYQLPTALRRHVEGRRVGIVNDVINAGSAVRGTHADLGACGADTVAVAALLTLGDTPQALADEWNVELVAVAAQANTIWKPAECPLCAEARPLDNG